MNNEFDISSHGYYSPFIGVHDDADDVDDDVDDDDGVVEGDDDRRSMRSTQAGKLYTSANVDRWLSFRIAFF